MKPGTAGALLALGLLGAASTVLAEVAVTGAWARATLPGQKVAGVYMQLTSETPAKLVGVKSAAAAAAEVHQMSHQAGVMKMRRLDQLALPAGKTVSLEPGGYHIMLLDLRASLKAGDRVKLTLIVEQAGKRIELPVQVQVRSLLDEGDGPIGHD